VRVAVRSLHPIAYRYGNALFIEIISVNHKLSHFTELEPYLRDNPSKGGLLKVVELVGRKINL
jgi:hypothetical protein